MLSEDEHKAISDELSGLMSEAPFAGIAADEGWELLHDGEYEGRGVRVFRRPGGGLKVETSQEQPSGSAASKSQTPTPLVLIAASPEHLQRILQSNGGFDACNAAEISRLAREVEG